MGSDIDYKISRNFKLNKMDYKEIFDQLNKLTKGFILVRGICDLIKNNEGKYIFEKFDDYTIYESTGNYDEDLMAERFDHETEFEDIECEGFYKFTALLSYSPAQIGNYPPPNIELPAYYDLYYIEFELKFRKEENDNFNNQ
jgi:hypothetical protein